LAEPPFHPAFDLIIADDSAFVRVTTPALDALPNIAILSLGTEVFT
jgi:hypothetical protein